MLDVRRPRGTIASTLSEARASLKDPTRPFTPAAMTRARNLFLSQAGEEGGSSLGSPVGSSPEQWQFWTESPVGLGLGPAQEEEAASSLEGQGAHSRRAGGKSSSKSGARTRRRLVGGTEMRGESGLSEESRLDPARAFFRASCRLEDELLALAASVKELARCESSGGIMGRGAELPETRLARMLGPWIKDGSFNFDASSPGRAAVLDALAELCRDSDVRMGLCVARDTLLLLDGGRGPSDAAREASACRAVFQMSRTPANDALFAELRVVPPLVAILAKAAQRMTSKPAKQASEETFWPATATPPAKAVGQKQQQQNHQRSKPEVVGSSSSSSSSSSAFPPNVNMEALIYAAGTVKNLTNDVDQNQFEEDEAEPASSSKKGGVLGDSVCVLCDLLRAGLKWSTGSTSTDQQQSQSRRRKHVAQLLIQVAGALRNLSASSGHLRRLESARAAGALAAVLRPMAHHSWELVLNASRALAKLSVYSSMRAALDRDPRRLLDLLEILHQARDRWRRKSLQVQTRQAAAAVLVRIAFILANLTADNDRNRRLIGLDLAGAEPVLDALRDAATAYCVEHQAWAWQGEDDDDQTKKKGENSTSHPQDHAPQDHAPQDHAFEKMATVEQVLVKMLRLTANLAINPAVGVKLAEACAGTEGSGGGAGAGTDPVSSALHLGLAQGRHELVLNALGALTNLSFYILQADWSTHSETRHRASCDALLSVLCQSDASAVAEAARALGNLSRAPDVRRVMCDAGAADALVLLLSHPSRHVVKAATGAMVNLAADNNAFAVLLKPSLGPGALDLLAVLRAAGLRDLDLAALACKAIHNLLLHREALGLFFTNAKDTEPPPNAALKSSHKHSDDANSDNRTDHTKCHSHSEPTAALLRRTLNELIDCCQDDDDDLPIQTSFPAEAAPSNAPAAASAQSHFLDTARALVVLLDSIELSHR